METKEKQNGMDYEGGRNFLLLAFLTALDETIKELQTCPRTKLKPS